MGARLVGHAYVYATDIPLNPNEFRLLAYMALTALDDEGAAARYFDSRESSALALGRGAAALDDDKQRTAAFEAVKVAIRGLVSIGAIVRVKQGKAGQRAEYRLQLSVVESSKTAEYRSRVRKAQPSSQGRFSLPSSEGSAFPRGKVQPSPKEPLQEPLGTTAGRTSLPSRPPLALVDNLREAIA